MADIKTVKKHMAELFDMKESFDVFLKDTESSDNPRRCYAIYQFIHQLVLNTNYDVKVTDFDTSGHEVFIKTLINDGKFKVYVYTIRKPTRRQIGDRIYIIIYEQPSGRHVADFSFDNTTVAGYGMPFTCTIEYKTMANIDSKKYQVFSDVALAIVKTINWYLFGK